jgi:hypothetical protein
MDVRKVLDNQMMPNNFPVKLDEVTSNKKYVNINNHLGYKIDSIDIETFHSNHPSPTLVFKLSEGGRSFVYVTDNEIYLDDTDGSGKKFSKMNQDLVEFCRGADTLYTMLCLMKNHFKKG